VDPLLLAELSEQDAVLRHRRLEVWIGSEPTFTDRRSQDPWWLTVAEGGDKLGRARALLADLAPRLGAGHRLVDLEGRHFEGEPAPRFCLGVRFRRGGAPADGEVQLTVVPDPGVVEVNTAPAPDLATFFADVEAIYAAAGAVGLSPVRWRFNGRAADSGGGGQLTLGGPTPEASPFFRHPTLLPRLIRFLCNHPSLSYAFAGECVGSASQGPRPDEGVRERFEELQVAVDRLEARGARPDPQELWETLAPLLVDASGNSHRAELNVEKLWNPHLPGRGRLGLVELRSLRMPATAGRLAALAALFRALVARLVAVPYAEPLSDWGASLHDQLALPTFLEEDLRGVLDDLAAHGVGLGPVTTALLLERPEPLAEIRLERTTLTVVPALEFWPLLGDVASQERAGARLVDASTERVEVRIAHDRGADPGRLGADGWEVPLTSADSGRRHVAGLRYRAFVPRPGLHPGLPAQDPLLLTWEREGRRVGVELHGWIPGGGTYPGLPDDDDEARRRCRERVRFGEPGRATLRRPLAGGGVTLDLRRLSALRGADGWTMMGGST
jgi:uncharacterized protein (DUF2126 family)